MVIVGMRWGRGVCLDQDGIYFKYIQGQASIGFAKRGLIVMICQ
jgi:hypothetical protein